jgi:hypothetical protein
MAKAQSFAEKAAKLARKHDVTAICPDTNKETRILNVRMVKAIKSNKGTYKFSSRNMRIYESTFKEYKP